MIEYYRQFSQQLIHLTVEHIQIVITSLLIALVIASTMTIILHFYKKWQDISLTTFSLLYAIPSFAFFALLIPVTGLGQTTAIVVLVVYAQYTLIRTFLAGLSQVDSSITQSAIGMGMTKWQVFWKVEVPLSLPSFFAGLRLTITALVGITTIAASINGGGLGVLLFDGLRTMSMVKILWGAILTVSVTIYFNIMVYLMEDMTR
ncbi:ABC transporter permease [Carnobacteriaceae bacterium zg-ZUI252]|nr:ABC transporter permease [Carnobacteriaceae bacterium zg-ZUI252]MBS4770621.1 ABC transporter permease [Carnobacteriaceae bacterium zg-ZUI240]